MFISSVTHPPAPRGLRLSNDVVFKSLFCRQPHLLSDLINAVRHPAAPVSVAAILNPHLLPERPDGKQVIFDIWAKDTQGQRFIVEMQMRKHSDWSARNVYYLARGLAGQLVSGQNYGALRPSIGITLLGQDCYTNKSDQSDWRFTLRDALTSSIEFDQALQLYVVELRKAETLRQGHAALKDWVVCLSHDLNEDIMDQITHPPVLEALKHLKAMYSEEELRIIAIQRDIAAMDERSVLRDARKEGYQALLKDQIICRFGAVPADIELKLRNAQAEELIAWAHNMLNANTMDDVFH